MAVSIEIIFVIFLVQLKHPLHVSQGVFLCYQKGAEPLQFECSCFTYAAFSACLSTEPVQVMRCSFKGRQENVPLQRELPITDPVTRFFPSKLAPLRTLPLLSKAPDSVGKVKLRLQLPAPQTLKTSPRCSLASLPQLQGWNPDSPKPRLPRCFRRLCCSVLRLSVFTQSACCGGMDSHR